MYLDLTPELRELRDELREYFDKMMTPELINEYRGTEGGGPLYHAALQQMGKDGLLGFSWPKEYGGQGRSWLEQFVFCDEVQRAGFPLPFLTLNSVAPSIMKYGTQEQKDKFLPDILAGKIHFAIGYSEPESGTDLASLTTKAVKDGDDWVINGSKIFTSLAQYADYIWCAVRTDPEAPKHKGISMMIVDTKDPGFSWTPIHTISGLMTTATYYQDVRVPDGMVVGGLNNGWSCITSQLNHERISLVTPGTMERYFNELVDWAKETKLSDGRRVIDQGFVKRNLAEVKSRLEALRLMTWKQAWAMTQGDLHFADASGVKVYGTEMAVRCWRLMMEVIGASSTVKTDSPGSVLTGIIEMYEKVSLILTFGGGTNEIQRDIIAMAGLKMPRAPRV